MKNINHRTRVPLRLRLRVGNGEIIALEPVNAIVPAPASGERSGQK